MIAKISPKIILPGRLFSLLAVLDPRLLSPYPDHLLSHLSKLQTVFFNKLPHSFREPHPHPGFSPSHYPTHVGSTLSSPPLSPSITHSLFHSRLKTPLPQVFSTLDFTIDTHWTDLTDSWPDSFSFAHRFCFSF